MKHTIESIPPGTTVFIDTNIFLFAFWQQQPLAHICNTFLQRVKNEEIQGKTSSAVVAEIAHRVMIWEARKLFPKATVAYLQKHPEKVRLLKQHLAVASNMRRFNVDVLSVSIFDMHRAKEVRRDYGLMTNDSVIVGVMRGEKVRHLATYDAGFARVPDIQVWMPQIDE